MKYFIVIDMQNDFITGSLKNYAAEKIVPNIVEKIKELKSNGYKIIGTHDTHDDSYMESQEGKNLPVVHCIKNTHGWEIVSEINSLLNIVIDKCNFGFTGWKDYIKEPEKIVLCGTVTSICVASNATILKSLFPETEIEVIADLCADISDENHNAALTVMKAQQIKIS